MSETTTTQYHYWLERLKQLRGSCISIADNGEEETATCVGYASAKSAKTDDLDPLTTAQPHAGDPEVAWRLEAFRTRLPSHGPIWPPRIRQTSQCDAPSHCSLCGDTLLTNPAPRFPRCGPCIWALWLALNERREGSNRYADEA